MQLIFDNIIATIVAAVLGLSLMSQQINNRQAALERQAVYHAKEQALGFGEWLEDDIVKLGARFGRARDRFTAITEHVDGKPYTRRFEIYYHERVLDTDRVLRTEVRYDLAEDDDIKLVLEHRDDPFVDRTLQAYRLVRFERHGEYNVATRSWGSDEPSWVATPEYGSPSGLRYFHVEPLDSNLERVSDEESERADYVRIEFVVMPTLFPLYRARLIPKSGLFWGTTIEIRPF